MQSESTAISLSSGQTTTYVISNGHQLQGLSVDYVIAAALTAFILRFGIGLIRRLMPSGFWLFHVGCTAVALHSVITAACVPRRYADYPGYIGWINRLNFTGAIFGILGLALLAILALTAPIQTLMRRKI